MDVGQAWGLHATLPRSAANGPGLRYVIWVQGCSLGCKGCFNPETHSSGVERMAVSETVQDVLATPGIDGVTLTGGEPLEQPDAVASFATSLRRSSDLSIVVLTGYTRQEVMQDSGMLRAATACDVLVCGRYNEQQRVAKGLRGSRNKEYWFLTDRYGEADFDQVPEAEFVIHLDGTVTATGVDPILLGEMS